jgi:beta-glucosidase/6-phospho-beta-glucosidase/beta-galactosidase
MIEAHARVYDAVKAADTVDADGDGVPAEVGIVYNLEAVAPADPQNPLDVSAAANAQYLLDQAFLDGITLGNLDGDLSGNPTYRADLANRLDFLGINYYARIIVQGTDGPVLPAVSPLLNFNVLTLQYDYAYPRGIYECIKFASRYKVPMLISETGVADPADTGAATAWIVETLSWVSRAAREGMPVTGYFYWSLMDNYEWNHGMTVKMGLYAVDPNDAQKARQPRSPVSIYGRISSAGKVLPDLAGKYPISQ